MWVFPWSMSDFKPGDINSKHSVTAISLQKVILRRACLLLVIFGADVIAFLL
ncbi:MAG: hypothetical protein RSA79_02940 [Oscillospiraceae bacterium]